MRVSDTEREQVADALRQAFGEGRLDLEEFDERVQQAYQAKTYRDLAKLTADLPDADAPVPAQEITPAQTRSGQPVPARPNPAVVVPVLLVLVGITIAASIATGVPMLWPLFFFGIWGFSRRGRYGRR